MNIVGIEVRRNTGVAVGVIAGEKVELTYGDTLRVNVNFDYRGISQTVTLYGAIGVRAPLSFDEILHNEVSIDLPESLTFTPCPRSVDIPITADINPGTDYDLYVKIREYPEAGLPEVDNVIDIVGMPPTYELIQETIYPFSYIYDGEVEVTIATFKIDPFLPSAWAGELFAKKLDEEYRARGGRPLEVRVYVDKTPLLWTDYRIELIGTPLGEEVEVAAVGVAGIPIAIAVLIIALAIIAVIVVATLMWERFQASFEQKPGLEEVKPAWGKETLILAIQDAEVHWERPVTPPETLVGMSEEELRVLLDQIAEEEVPSEVIWLPLAVVGGIAILGAGVAVAVVSYKRKGKP